MLFSMTKQFLIIKLFQLFGHETASYNAVRESTDVKIRRL